MSNDGDVSGSHGNSDYWVVKLSNNGGIQWQRCFGSADYDQAKDVIQQADGSYIITGSTVGPDYRCTWRL